VPAAGARSRWLTPAEEAHLDARPLLVEVHYPTMPDLPLLRCAPAAHSLPPAACQLPDPPLPSLAPAASPRSCTAALPQRLRAHLLPCQGPAPLNPGFGLLWPAVGCRQAPWMDAEDKTRQQAALQQALDRIARKASATSAISSAGSSRQGAQRGDAAVEVSWGGVVPAGMRVEEGEGRCCCML